MADRIFLVENFVEMAALGPKKFFTQLFLVLDFSVVLLSFVLELVFHYLKHTFSEKATQALIFFRIWRFVRIGHVSYINLKETAFPRCKSYSMADSLFYLRNSLSPDKN